MAYQRAYFPMKVINVTQGYGSKSRTHKLSYALDLSGKDSGQDNIYAPFDCKVTKLYQPKDTKKNANTVWLTSLKKVLSPNGYYGYLTVSITHPREITNLKIGQIFKQNDFMFKEGKTGNASGNHIHLEVAKGKKAAWSKKSFGNYSEYVIDNGVIPEEYLFVKDNAILKNVKYNGEKLHFIREKDITYKVYNVLSEPLLIHKEANYHRNSVIKNKGLKNGDEVLRFFNKNSMAYIYHYETLGYIANKYLKK